MKLPNNSKNEQIKRHYSDFLRHADGIAKQDLSKATILTRLKHLKRFLKWLSRQTGYKRKIIIDDVEYLNLPDKDIRARLSNFGYGERSYSKNARRNRHRKTQPCPNGHLRRDRNARNGPCDIEDEALHAPR